MSDGTEAPWGTILAWEPPTRFVMSWKPTLDRRAVDRGRARASRAAAAGSTRLDLEHRGWELLGDGALKREGYDEGWEQLFVRFRAVTGAG